MLLLQGMLSFVLNAGQRSRNPLFIGNAFATGCNYFVMNVAYTDNVAIPYSSGMLLLLALTLGVLLGFSILVAIPYSSGMLLLHRYFPKQFPNGYWRRNPLFIGNAFATAQVVEQFAVAGGTLRRNPLFIGNAFATKEDRAPEEFVGKSWSQSPIHRECFCYRGQS